MIKGDIPNKPRQMINFLMESIHAGKLGEGAKLPPIRNLMQQFGISYGSVKRGIDYLEHEGLIEKRVGNGTFVKKKCKKSKKKKSSIRQIAVFLNKQGLYTNPGIYHTVFLGLQKAVEELGWSLAVHYLDKCQVCKSDIEKLAGDAAGILLLSEYDMSLSDFSFHVPSVGVCMHSVYPGNMSTVDIDPFAASATAVDYFKQKKIKKVVVIGSDKPAYKFRVDLFSQYWQENGGKVKFKQEGDHIKFDKETAYLFANGSLLQQYSLEYEEKKGCCLSQEVTILGIDGKNRVDPSYHPAPSVYIDWQIVGKYALEECIRRINLPGSTPKRIYIPGYLSEEQ